MDSMPKSQLSEEQNQILEKYRELAENKLESHRKAIIDFLKYSATISLGALLWIGTNIPQIHGFPQLLFMIGFALLAISVICAIVALFFYVHAWETEGTVLKDFLNIMDGFFVKDKLEMTPEELSKGLIHARNRFFDISYQFKSNFDRFVTIHVMSLFFGITCFIVAIILNLT